MDALLSDINQAGVGRGLDFELFRPGQTNVREYYAELPIAVKVSGKYHDLGAFASDIANLPRIVTLNNVNVQAGKSGNLTFDATAKTYRYLDPERSRPSVPQRQGLKRKGLASETLDDFHRFGAITSVTLPLAAVAAMKLNYARGWTIRARQCVRRSQCLSQAVHAVQL